MFYLLILMCVESVHKVLLIDTVVEDSACHHDRSPRSTMARLLISS